MTWYRPFGQTETILLAIFLLVYGLYIFRAIVIAKALTASWKQFYIKASIRAAFFLCVILALMGPSFGETKREIREQGKDIFICVDLSESMNAIDVAPNRITLLKEALFRIYAAFPTDRLGLIIFSSEAFLQCPLTFDQNALALFTETLSTDLVPSEGTDFAYPLQMALDKLENRNKQGRQMASKVVLLVSDGEDFGEQTNKVANKISDAGIKLFTLGIGTKQGGPIPDPKGGYKLDNEGEKVITRLNTSDLRDLADKTGGQYFEISDENNQLNKLISAIDKIEGQVREIRKIDVGANKYYYFVALAILLMICDILFTVRVIKL